MTNAGKYSISVPKGHSAKLLGIINGEHESGQSVKPSGSREEKARTCFCITIGEKKPTENEKSRSRTNYLVLV